MKRIFPHVLLTVLFSSFALLSFSFPHKAFAACTYNNTTESSKYTLAKGQEFTITTKVTRSGDLSTCSNPANAKLYFKGTGTTPPLFESKSLTFSGDNAQIVFKVNTGSLDPKFYTTGSTLQPKVEIWAGPFAEAITKVTESGYLNITVTGSTGASGSVTSNVYFKAADGSSKGTYSKNDDIQILLNIPDKSQIDKLDPSIQKIYVEFKVNGKVIGKLENKSRTDFKDPIQGDVLLNTKVTTANGFKDGTNNVTVELWSAGTSLKISTAIANLQATGLGTSSGGVTPDPGCTKDYPWAGYDKDGKEVCWNDDGTKSIPKGSGGGDKDKGGGNKDGNTDDPGDLEGVETIEAPIGVDSIGGLIVRLINYLLTLVGALAVLMIIIGGFRMVMSAGNESAVTAGKQTVTWAVIGLIVTLMAYTFVTILQSILNRK